jgi:hypothetical protein
VRTFLKEIAVAGFMAWKYLYSAKFVLSPEPVCRKAATGLGLELSCTVQVSFCCHLNVDVVQRSHVDTHPQSDGIKR